MLAGLVGGSAIGLLIGGGIVVLFKGGNWMDFFEKLTSVAWGDLAKVTGFMLLWTVVSSVLQIIIHEGGHLVAGLLTGYRFVSFRVFNLTIIKKDGKFLFRRFSLGGTGGQCLMAPPDKPLDEINTFWYNLGGVLANIIVALIALLALCFCDLPMWAETWMIMLIIVGVIYALMNGLPLKINGITNDGYNMLFLEKSKTTKQYLLYILQANASIQEGLQPKDLPASYFSGNESIDWSDALQTNWQMMVMARMENLHQWEELYKLTSEALSQKEKMPAIFWKEMTIEMIFVCLVTGRMEEARKLYTPEVEKYIKDYAPTQSSKQRMAFTIALLLEGLEEKADETFRKLKMQRDQFVLQGEVKMDIELMEWIQSAHAAGFSPVSLAEKADSIGK